MALNRKVQAVPRVMIIVEASRKKADASARDSFALTRNSALVALAAAVWWLNEQEGEVNGFMTYDLNEQTSCAPAPI